MIEIHMKTVGIFMIVAGALILGITYSNEVWSFTKTIGRSFIKSDTLYNIA